MGAYFAGICYTMSGNTKIFEEEQWNGFTWSDINIKDKNYDDSINTISNDKCLYTTKCSEMYKIVNKETSYWCYSDYASVKNYCYFDKNTVKINLRYSYVPNYDYNISVYIGEKAYPVKNCFPLEIPYSEDVEDIHVYNKGVNHSGRTLYKYTYSPTSITPTENKWIYVTQDFDTFEITYNVTSFIYDKSSNTGKMTLKIFANNVFNNPFISYIFYEDTNDFKNDKFIRVSYGVSIGQGTLDPSGTETISLNDCYKGVTLRDVTITSHSTQSNVIGPSIEIKHKSDLGFLNSLKLFKKYKYRTSDPYRYMAIYVIKNCLETNSKGDFLTTYDYS